MPEAAASRRMDPKTRQIWTINRHLRAAVEQVGEGVVVLDLEPQGGEGPRVVFVNRGITELSGHRGEDLLGCPLATIMGGEKLGVLLERMSAIAESRRVFELESPLRRSGGGEIMCRWRVSCLEGDDGRPANFMLTVSERREAAAAPDAGAGGEVQVAVIEGVAPRAGGEELRLARMETLALLASGIAHDFKNILTTVMANLSLVRQSMGDGPLAGQIDDATKASESGCKMAEQLLAFARGSGGGGRVETDVGRLLTEAARLSTYGAKARCDVSVEDGLWSAVVNVTQVTQVINNLIINARQAMGDTGTFQARLSNAELDPGEVADLPQGEYLRLDVIDRGCGIPAGALDAIFTAFYTTKEAGNGLGLATCQTIIREHGGLITVESEEGKGSCFTVYIPSTGERVEPDVEEGAREVYRGAGAVLVVDDQEPILRVARALLEQLGYEVVCAASGEDGVAKFRRRRSEGRPVSAVLMDMTLPGGIDGGEATGQILEIDPEAKVVASSGYLEDSMDEAQRRRGFAGILSKPYDLEKVSRVLHDVLCGEEGLGA